jgi:Mg2+ and Co2+ transporter CorA
MEKLKCIICCKEINASDDYFFDGGDVLISFGYGSKHDQLGFRGVQAENDMEKMLQCDQIRAKICDDCFEKVFPMCKGYKVRTETIEERIV